MFKSSIVLTVVACLVASCHNVAGGNIGPEVGDSKLMQLMRSTRAMQQSNPMLSLQCFHYYSEIFDQYLSEYKAEYAKCEEQTEAEIDSINESYKSELHSLNDSSSQACERLSGCYNVSNANSSMNCYTEMASYNIKVMRNISADASTFSAQLSLQFEVIRFEEDRCTTQAKRKYEENTDASYGEFQKCLNGEQPVPETSTTTTTTTAASTTSTELPTGIPFKANQFNSNMHRIFNNHL